MKRRRLFMAMSVITSGYPWTSSAQQALNVPRIGYMGPMSTVEQAFTLNPFLQRLDELGWTNGQTIKVEQRWADGRQAPLADFAAEYVKLKVDLIVTSGAPAVQAAKRATTTIPIVFTVATDPVGTGLVASLARPGGNVTGLSYQGPELAGKRIELIGELLPALRRLAVMGNPLASGAKSEMREALNVARSVGWEAIAVEIPDENTIAAAVAKAAASAEMVYVVADPLVIANHRAIIEPALRLRLPTMFSDRPNVLAGGLMSYGPSLVALNRRAAEIVDKILRGARPGDIPVEQPTKFELIINLKTAKTLGLTIPPILLARADEVIE